MKKLFLVIISILLLCSNAQALELSDEELFWLTQNVYWESRSESELGQFLVALVTINRLKSKRFPNNIKDVVTQRSQFSWFWDGKSDIPKEPEAWKKAKRIAMYVCKYYDSIDPAHRRIYWYHRDDVFPSWRNAYIKLAKVERHIFYTDG